MNFYQDIFTALDKSHISYLVAGGIAVNFHSVNRATLDLDLIIHLEEKNILAFDQMMTQLGYQPRLPVKGKDLADQAIRKFWRDEKNMVMFTYIHPQNVFAVIDVFIEEPKPFIELQQRRKLTHVFGVEVSVLGLEDLIQLKKEAGRDKDLYDVKLLEAIKREP